MDDLLRICFARIEYEKRKALFQEHNSKFPDILGPLGESKQFSVLASPTNHIDCTQLTIKQVHIVLLDSI